MREYSGGWYMLELKGQEERDGEIVCVVVFDPPRG